MILQESHPTRELILVDLTLANRIFSVSAAALSAVEAPEVLTWPWRCELRVVDGG